MHATERPPSCELEELCDRCSGRVEPDLGDLGHDADFDRCLCEEAELEVPSYRYDVELGAGWHVPCATFRKAIEVTRGQEWFRIVRWSYVPSDEDDDGLDEREKLAIDCGEGVLRDLLVDAIDSDAERN